MIFTRSAAKGRRTLMAAVAIVASGVLAGCASLGPKTPEEEVKARAEARWDALVKRDFDKAYAFAQPGFRAVVKQEVYKNRFGNAGSWKGAQIHDVTCEASRCTARVRLTVGIQIPRFAKSMPEVVSYHDEVWIRDEGQWWYLEKI